MDEILFDSLKDLYNRLLPALKNKKRELILLGYDKITEEDIWEFLKQKKWVNSHNLQLYEMVDDIINLDYLSIEDYYREVVDIDGNV